MKLMKFHKVVTLAVFFSICVDYLVGHIVLSEMQSVKQTCLKEPHIKKSSLIQCSLRCRKHQMDMVYENEVCYCIAPHQYVNEDTTSSSSKAHNVFKTGNSKENPRSSCKSIKNLCSSCGDGFYWMKIGEEVVKVFCEMETDGGGWIMLAHTNVSHESEAEIRHYDHIKSDDISLLHTAYSTGSFALSLLSITKLYHDIGIREFRVYCYKLNTKRTVHFVLNSDMVKNFEHWYLTSHEQFESVSQVSAVPGVNPYRYLPDDNSILKSYKGQALFSNLYAYVLYKSGTSHVSIEDPTRMECDDSVYDEDFKSSGVWKFYGR